MSRTASVLKESRIVEPDSAAAGFLDGYNFNRLIDEYSLCKGSYVAKSMGKSKSPVEVPTRTVN